MWGCEGGILKHIFILLSSSFELARSLIQILDSEMYDLMHAHGDYTHFYFCYRWFLLDFKRELVYADVFSVWECIWAAKHVASSQFVLFLALALLETYRDIIIVNSMDFTDVIKFFNGKWGLRGDHSGEFILTKFLALHRNGRAAQGQGRAVAGQELGASAADHNRK